MQTELFKYDKIDNRCITFLSKRSNTAYGIIDFDKPIKTMIMSNSRQTVKSKELSTFDIIANIILHERITNGVEITKISLAVVQIEDYFDNWDYNNLDKFMSLLTELCI